LFVVYLQGLVIAGCLCFLLKFAVYGGYFGVLGLVFLFFAMWVFIKGPRGDGASGGKRGSWKPDEEVPREEPPVGSTEVY
jgi:hypothetical protein